MARFPLNAKGVGESVGLLSDAIGEVILELGTLLVRLLGQFTRTADIF